MAARCIPTATTPLQRVGRWLRRADLRLRLICAIHALRTAEAYGDRDGYASYWLDRIDHLTRELRAIESA